MIATFPQTELAVTLDHETETNIRNFREIWNTRHFPSPPPNKKDKLKGASSLMNTMRYYVVVGQDRSLKDVFAETKVIPLLPNPNYPDQWTDQAIMDTVRLVLCSETNGEYRYDQLIALAAIAAASVFSDDKKEFDFVCGLYKAAYPSEIRSVLGHVWKYRVAVKGDDNSDNPSATEFRRMLRWIYHRVRPHSEGLMSFLDKQLLRPEC